MVLFLSSGAARAEPRGVCSLIAALILRSSLSVALGGESPEPSSRRPEPEPASREAAQARIRERLKAKYAKRLPGDLRALAYELFDESCEAGLDPLERYVRLRETSELAAQGGDAETALDAVGAMAREFEVEALVLKQSLLATAEKGARTARDSAGLAESALSLLEPLVARGDLEAARTLARKAHLWSQKTPRASLAALAEAYGKELVVLERESPRARAGEAALLKDPDSPEANLTAGKWACFLEGDWKKGLPLLARGSDASLKALAQMDLSGPSGAAGQVELGDRWRALGEKTGGPMRRKRLLARALTWYEAASPPLAGSAAAPVAEKLNLLRAQLLPTEVRLILGRYPRSKGISLRRNPDGLHEGLLYAGKPCVRLNRCKDEDPVRYLYLDIEDRWAEVKGPVELEIEYLDAPPGPFWVEYDSEKTGAGGGSYRHAGRTIVLGGTGNWKIARFDLSDPLFRNRQNARSDFRIRREPGAGLYVHRITVRRSERGASPAPQRKGG